MLAEPPNANEIAVRRANDRHLQQVKQATALLTGNGQQFRLIRRYRSSRGVTFAAYENLQSRSSMAIVFHAPRHQLRRDTPREPLEDTRCTFFADHLVLWSSVSDAVDEVFAEWMFKNQNSSVLITGYATGAALAMIEAARIKCYRQFGPDRLQIVTFGCPPLGSPTVLPELLPQSIHIACNQAHVDEDGTIFYLVNTEFWDLPAALELEGLYPGVFQMGWSSSFTCPLHSWCDAIKSNNIRNGSF